MIVSYLDESGDTGSLPTPDSPVQPLLCLLGLTLDHRYLRPFTLEFIDVKKRFFPGLFVGTLRLSGILTEIKGSDIRAAFRTDDHDRRHHHIGFLDALLDLVENYRCRIFGRVWVKAIAGRFDGVAVYTSSAQSICSTFNHLLNVNDELGVVIADSRTFVENRAVSFSILTQKLGLVGDAFPHIVEAPTFGHSNNHAGLQVCDLLCSGLLFPISAYTYCTGYVDNVHVHPNYALLKKRYAARLQGLQHRYRDQDTGRWMGGLVVSDPLGHKSAAHLFREVGFGAGPTDTAPVFPAAPPRT